MLSGQGFERINSLKSTLRIPTVLEFAGFSAYTALLCAMRQIADVQIE